MKLKQANVAGMITHQKDGYVGGYGTETYKEKAEHAREIGLYFVKIDLTEENARQIREGGNVTAKHWDGRTLSDVTIPARNIKAIYDFSELDMPEYKDPAYDGIISALTNNGVRFVNGPKAKQIGNDKQLSQELFEEVGVRTPITMQYNRENAKALLHESGFIFIKDIEGVMGNGQVTILSTGNGFMANVDGTKTGFRDVGSALDFAEESVQGRLIVQEGIVIPRLDGRVWDFRAIFQKDGSGNTVMPLVLVRIGAIGRDQSNIDKGGEGQDPYIFYPNFSTARCEIEEIGMKVFKGLERKAGDVGEIGMDFLASTKGELILIEINPTPGYTAGYIRDLSNGGPVNFELTLQRGGNMPTEEEIHRNWAVSMRDRIRNPVSYSKHIVESE
ncbi:MAG: YheC/YheD family protein [Candidatus Micrarchaeota archaeon]|nr:YheC/YheD family protein [Candidatus Micrarchaeota archaeon]MDE1858981.1 YheC/YheD family protein [Candidatus Micrarchaeota archaeon]